jgi:hypothetical protein
MLEVSRNAVAAGEKQLVSCAVENIKCYFVTLDPMWRFTFNGLGRSQCLCGGADAGLNSCYAACGCGTEYRCWAMQGEACGDMLEAMARIAPSQPNEAMARIAPRSLMVPMVTKKNHSA